MDVKSLVLGGLAGFIACYYLKAEKKEVKKDAASPNKGALHMGAIHMNPNHMGAIHANPYGAIQMGAIHQNPHSAFDQTQAFPHAARAPWGYGAIHLGALEHK